MLTEIANELILLYVPDIDDCCKNITWDIKKYNSLIKLCKEPNKDKLLDWLKTECENQYIEKNTSLIFNNKSISLFGNNDNEEKNKSISLFDNNDINIEKNKTILDFLKELNCK